MPDPKEKNENMFDLTFEDELESEDEKVTCIQVSRQVICYPIPKK